MTSQNGPQLKCVEITVALIDFVGIVDSNTMEVLEVESCICGHHVYKDIWTPTAGEELPCAREGSNTKDP